MYKELEDVPGECNARLRIDDDFGEGGHYATIRCELPEGHGGVHRERYKDVGGGVVTVTWERDVRPSCDLCGTKLSLDGTDWGFANTPGKLVCEKCERRPIE